MTQGSLTRLGHLGFIIFASIGCWGVYRFRQLHNRLADDIGRASNHEPEPIGRSFSGYLIYAAGSDAQRIQTAYLRAIRKHVALLLVILLAWMVFGGWLLVTLADLIRAIRLG